MRKHLLFLSLAIFSISFYASGQKITSAQSGNWNAGSTWVGGVVPASTDSVVIAAGHTVTLNVSTTIKNLTIQATGQLTFSTLVSPMLTVNGDFDNSGTLSLFGTIIVAGSFTNHPTGSVTSPPSASVFRVNGPSYTNNGNFSLGTNSALQFAGSGPQTLSGSGTFIIPRLSTILATAGSSLTLAVPLTVGDVQLGNTKIFLGNNHLTSGGFNTIGNTSGYIVTNGTGKVRWAPASASTAADIPIGNSTHNPIRIANNTTQHIFSIKVNDNLTNAAYGPAIVNAEWDIQDETGGPVSVDITLYWYTADEAAAFNRTNCYVSRFSSGSWQQVGAAGSATLVSSMWSRIATGVTSFSPFAVGNGCDLTLPPVVLDQPDQAQCNNGTFTMTQSAPSAGTGVWTLESGTATITTPSSPTTTVTGVPVGTSATVKWTVTHGACSAFDLVTLTNDAQPVVTDQPDQVQCNNGTFTMTQSAPSIGSGVWTLQSGTATITTPSSPTTTVTGVPAGTSATVKWTVTNGACSAFDLVMLTNTAPPTTANAGSSQTICENESATLAANNPSVGTGAWSVVSGPSLSLSQFSNIASPTATFTPAGGTGNYVLRWTISNPPCSASTADVTITVNPNVSAGTVSGTSPLCIGQTTTYTSNGTAGGSWSSSNTAVATVNASTGLVKAVGAGTIDITYTVTTGCGAPVHAFKTLTVNQCGGDPEYTRYCTYSQGFYGNAGNYTCEGLSSAQLIDQLLNQGGALQVGLPGKSFTIEPGKTSCLMQRLPASGSPSPLIAGNDKFTGNNCAINNPLQNGRFRNVLLGQTISLALNLRHMPALGNFVLTSSIQTYAAENCAGTVAVPGTLQSYTIPQSVLNALGGNKTVNGLLNLANQALGGGATNGASLSDINAAISNLIAAFHYCRLVANTVPPVPVTSTVIQEQENKKWTNIHIIPNPFTQTAIIRFSVSEESLVKLEIFNSLGQKITELYQGNARPHQEYSVKLEGHHLKSGIYYYRITAGKQQVSGKLIKAD